MDRNFILNDSYGQLISDNQYIYQCGSIEMKLVDILFYLILFSGIVVSLSAVVHFRANHVLQFVVIAVVCSFYLFWSLVYHAIKRELALKLFLEYLAIALIVLLVGFMVITPR